MREIILDTETTGLDYKKGDRIIEVACVELVNHIATGNHIQFYCSTTKKINKDAEKTHGLSNSFLDKFPSFLEQAQKLIDFVKKDILIIHNAYFDLGFINNELKMGGLEPLKNDFIDTVALARKKLSSRFASLDYLCNRFSIDLSSRKFHGALKDCNLLSEVYLELLGGRQTKLELKKPQNNKKEETKNTKNKINIHKLRISNKEIEEHKKFVESLSGPLWKKADY